MEKCSKSSEMQYIPKSQCWLETQRILQGLLSVSNCGTQMNRAPSSLRRGRQHLRSKGPTGFRLYCMGKMPIATEHGHPNERGTSSRFPGNATGSQQK